MGNSAAKLSDRADLFRIALLTPLTMGKELEKVPWTIACFKTPCWLTAILFSGRARKKKIVVIPLKIGAWNVRTFMDSAGSDRPQRRTALVGRELDDCSSEWDSPCRGMAIKRSWCWLHFLLEWTQERRAAWSRSRFRHQIKLCQKGLRTSKRHKWPAWWPWDFTYLVGHATIISAFAPIMTNLDEVKDKFYDDLDSVISATSRTDKLNLLGDFNARVGTDHQIWEGVIGTEGTGKRNSNGFLFLKKCAEHELLITNTVFRLPTRNKTSWMHPRSKHWHLIDHVIVRRKDRQDVRVTKTMCGADCWTDHRLVVSKLNLRI